MRKLLILGFAVSAMLAITAMSAGSAAAFSLWDECSKSGSPLEFGTADCNSTGTSFGWLEIKTLTTTDSLVSDLILSAGGESELCEGSSDGSVGAAGEDEVTELLNTAGEPITATKPVACTKLSGELCTSPKATPVNLPWATQLVESGDLLTKHSGGGNPGWLVTCSNGFSNECTREDTILKVENLLSELEVDETFNPAEESTCSNFFAPKGKVEGTVAILLAGTERALRAM